jgi:DeoR family ulaG and ulaABCDEF operon transcriptional repressor
MFMGAQGVGRLGIMERDPLLIQAEQKLIDQAEELIVLVDSSKFAQRSSLILCRLDRVDTVITDDAVSEDAAAMLGEAGVKLVVAEAAKGQTMRFPESA